MKPISFGCMDFLLLRILVIFLVVLKYGFTYVVPQSELVTKNTYPFLVLVYWKSGSEDKKCSGTLITPHWILTSATCINEKAGSKKVYVDFGNTVGSSSFQVVHSGYKYKPCGTASIHDIALIRLDDKAPPHQCQKLAQLHNNLVPLGTSCVELSFGPNFPFYEHKCEHDEPCKPPEDVLRKFDCHATNPNKCEDYGYVAWRNDMICAKPVEGKHSQFDSIKYVFGYTGGALFCDQKLVGIVSSEITDREKFDNMTGEVYTRVLNYLQWITDVTKKYEYPKQDIILTCPDCPECPDGATVVTNTMLTILLTPILLCFMYFSV